MARGARAGLDATSLRHRATGKESGKVPGTFQSRKRPTGKDSNGKRREKDGKKFQELILRMAPSERTEQESLIRQLCEARSQVAAMKAMTQDLKTAVKETHKRLLEEMVGSDVVLAMVQNRVVAERYLEHPDPKYRCVAIGILTNHWKPDESFAATCERLAVGDDDVDVRSAAITSLGVYYERTGNRRIGTILARLVEAAMSPKLRRSAYLALWQLVRGGDSLNEYLLMSQATVQIPDDLDWSLVSPFLSGDSSVG